MSKTNSFKRDWRLSPFDCKDSVNGDMPKWWQLAIGIPTSLLIAWVSIWMAAILLEGCNTESPTDAYTAESHEIKQMQADDRALDNLLLELIAKQNEL